MTEKTKDKSIAFFSTIVVHGLLILLFIFATLKANTSNATEEMLGIPVMFGNVADAYGDSEPLGMGANEGDNNANENVSPNVVEEPLPMAPSSAKTETKPQTNSSEGTATQNLEESIAIIEAEKIAKEKEIKEAEEQRIKAETERLAIQEAEKKAKINKQMEGLFGMGNENNTGSRGNTEGIGTQGVQAGNASYGATSGIGGWGSFELDGRSLGKGGLVKPKYEVNDYGVVVINILVDPKGNVIEASIGKGGNTTSAKLVSEAINAAKKTKFNEIQSIVNQRGSITYKFQLE